MASKLYAKAEKFVIGSFNRMGLTYQIKHFKRTVYWIKKLKPDADEALLIAAIAHDIERVFRKSISHKQVKESAKGFSDEKYIGPHQREGAEIIANFLKREGADRRLISRVKMLISKHEIGGNADQNLLKDADSISFFENNVTNFIKLMPKMKEEKINSKFDWMFNRITSKKDKKIVSTWYKNAINQLKQKK